MNRIHRTGSVTTHRPPRTDAPRHRVRSGDERFYGSTRWRKLRAWVLSRHPLCADPFGHHTADGRVEPATEVHHVIPRCHQPDLELDAENLQCLCKSCHSRITRGEAPRSDFKPASTVLAEGEPSNPLS